MWVVYVWVEWFEFIWFDVSVCWFVFWCWVQICTLKHVPHRCSLCDCWAVGGHGVGCVLEVALLLALCCCMFDVYLLFCQNPLVTLVVVMVLCFDICFKLSLSICIGCLV